MTDTAADVFSAMLRFVQDAAALALDLSTRDLHVTHKGDGYGQAFTRADAAISRMMGERFAPRLIEEETVKASDRAAGALMLADERDWTFIGDPIDGTAPFAGGLPGWGIMIAACRGGLPRSSVMILPAWVDERDRVRRSEDARSLLLAARDGTAYRAATRNGLMIEPLAPLPSHTSRTRHVGWLPVAACHYTLDYLQGYFPASESGYIADAAALATGRHDASVFNHKLWDLAPSLPILEACGFRLYRWPDLSYQTLNRT